MVRASTQAKVDSLTKARSAASRAKRERDRRDFEFTKRKYLTHLTDVLERCLKFTGDAFEDYGLEPYSVECDPSFVIVDFNLDDPGVLLFTAHDGTEGFIYQANLFGGLIASSGGVAAKKSSDLL